MAAQHVNQRWLLVQLLVHLLVLWTSTSMSDTAVHLLGPEAVTLQTHTGANVTVSSSFPINQSTVIDLMVNFSSNINSSSVITLPEQVVLPAEATSVSFSVLSHGVGQVTALLLRNVTVETGSPLRIRFLVIHSGVLSVISQVIGWFYFLAWSVSFYPQVWENWRRKSVIGLNFDFLALNITGFVAYSVFNIGLFWVPSIKEEFLKRNPSGINPVTANDVFFSLHAVLLCSIYIVQAAVYQRGGQRVSWTALFFLLIGWSFALISFFLALTRVITWLDYLYYCSYIKLGVTLIKYIPQAFMNYRRGSTEGWSIGNVLLDFTGGTLSILQMMFQAYNNDQWELLFGDPTKFGLGLFSVVFDILFMTQHYCLYRRPPQYQAVEQSAD